MEQNANQVQGDIKTMGVIQWIPDLFICLFVAHALDVELEFERKNGLNFWRNIHFWLTDSNQQ